MSRFRPQVVPEGCEPNGHLYAIRTRDGEGQAKLRQHLAERSIEGPPISICSIASSRVTPSLAIVSSNG